MAVNKARRWGKQMVVLLVFIVGVFLLSGCNVGSPSQVETVAAAQIQATVFAVEMAATSTSFVGTQQSFEATQTEIHRATDTPTKTLTPSITPTPSPTSTPENTATNTPVPLPPHKMVLVLEQTPLRKVKNENKQGVPVMVIYKSGGNRIVFKPGQKVMVYPGIVIADGGKRFWKVYPGQGGAPSSPALFILSTHVQVQ